MLNKIIHFSIKNKLIIGGNDTGTYYLGCMECRLKLPVDALPDVTNNQVQVITRAPTLAAQEVEQFITYPVERSYPISREYRNAFFFPFWIKCNHGSFKENMNIYFARQLITEKLKEAEEKIPKGIGQTGIGTGYYRLG